MRFFLILALLQTLLLPTFSAFPHAFDAYHWEKKAGDAFYKGSVTLPDGTRRAFQTRENRLYFPGGSKIRVTGYASPARATGARKVRREDQQTTTVTRTSADDPADEVAYGNNDAIVGDVKDDKTQGSETGGMSSGDLCHSIEAAARLYIGQENIDAEGGLSDLKGDSLIVGTLVDWACRLNETWTWRVALVRHDMRLQQTETTPTGTSERTRSYDRTSGMMAGTRRTGSMEYGLGLSYSRLPILKITQTALNASQLKQQGFGSLTLLGRYAPESGFQAGLALSPYAMDTNRYLAYAAEVGWRSVFGETWHWDLGVRYETVNVSTDSACRDNPACRDDASSELTLPQAWMGVGKIF